MKKLFTILCAVMLTVSLSAQTTETGTFLLEGSGMDMNMATISAQDQGDVDLMVGVDKSTVRNMTLGLLAGYFMMDGLAVGVAIDYSTEGTFESYTAAGSTDAETGESSMMISPAVRYYIGETGAFTQVKYGFGSDVTKSYTSGVDDEVTKRSALTFGAGYAIGLGDYVSLNPMVSYAMHTITNESNTTGVDDTVTKAGALNFGLGISVYLGN